MKWLEEDDFEGVIIFDESHKVYLPLFHDFFLLLLLLLLRLLLWNESVEVKVTWDKEKSRLRM